MDMSQFIPNPLTNEVLLRRPNLRYEGVIAAIGVEDVFNKWKKTRTTVPVLKFADGAQWIPNLSARRTLMEARGPESDAWVGRRVAVQLVREARTDRASGRLVEKYEKRAEPLADVTPSEVL